MANLVGATPVVETIIHRTQDFSNEMQPNVQQYGQSHNPGGAVLESIIGGALGSAIGRGPGRALGAGVGAGIGAITGDGIANQNTTPSDTAAIPVQRCQQVESDQNAVSEYMMTYEYDGQRFSARIP